MEFTNIQRYTATTVNQLLLSPSGKFINAHGEIVTPQNITTKEDLYRRVLSGELASTTDPRFILRDLNKTGDENAKPALKSIEHHNNFEHIALEQISPNANTDLMEQILQEQFSNIKGFFVDQGTSQLYLGKREVFTRVDIKPDGSKHIHILANKFSTVKKEVLQEELEELKNKQNLEPVEKSKVEAIEKALTFFNVKNVDIGIEQSLDFNHNYVQKLLIENVNKAFIANGLAPVLKYGSFSQNGKSNIKTTSESKAISVDLITENYSEEAVEKAVEKIQNEVVSNLDTVVIQQKLKDNNKQVAQLAEEMRRINAENRQLEEAQKAVIESQVLRNDNNNLKQELTTTKEEVKKLVEEVILLSEIEKEMKLNDEMKTVQITSLMQDIESKTDELNNATLDNEELQEEIKDISEKLIHEKNTTKNLNVFIDNLNGEVEKLGTEIVLLNDNNKLLAQEKEELIKDNLELLEDNKDLQSKNKHLNDGIIKIEEEKKAISVELEKEKVLNEELVKKNKDFEIVIKEQNQALELMKEQYNAVIKSNEEMAIAIESLNKKQNEQAIVIGELKDTNVKLVEEITTKDKAIELVSNLYKEVKLQLHATTQKLKSIVSKITSKEIKETVKNVVENNNTFERKIEEVNKSSDEEKNKKLEELRNLFSPAKKDNDTVKKEEEKNKFKPK